MLIYYLQGNQSTRTNAAAHSPHLDPSTLQHLESFSEDDGDLHDYSAIRQDQEASSPESGANDGDGESKHGRRTAGVAEDINHGTGESTPLDDDQLELLPRDKQRRTAYYDYASEKSLSQAEAKLFYQRHQLETSQYGSETHSPILRAKTFPAKIGGGLSRAGSMASRQSGRNHLQGIPNDVSASIGLGLPVGDMTMEDRDLQTPNLNGMEPHGQHTGNETQDRYVAADQLARSHSKHPDLPHEFKPPILATEGIHGAGAGVGVGAGAGGFATHESSITSELSTIYTNIQKVLDCRNKYIRLSLQGPSDNPKDDPGWRIYPPPPEPMWDDERDRGAAATSGTPSMSNSGVLPADQKAYSRPTSSAEGHTAQQPPFSPIRRKRKPGQDIGEDFEMSDLLPLPEAAEMTFKLDKNSVYQVYENSKSAELDSPILQIPTVRDFYIDLDQILSISSDGPSKSFAFRRLQYLEGKFNLYVLLNEYQEIADSKRVPHRDFYNVRKVDTHVHHSACMNQKHLLRFIKSKMKKSPDEVVMFRDGKHLTLKEVFESINLTAYDLSIDTLDMHVCSHYTIESVCLG